MTKSLHNLSGWVVSLLQSPEGVGGVQIHPLAMPRVCICTPPTPQGIVKDIQPSTALCNLYKKPALVR